MDSINSCFQLFFSSQDIISIRLVSSDLPPVWLILYQSPVLCAPTWPQVSRSPGKQSNKPYICLSAPLNTWHTPSVPTSDPWPRTDNPGDVSRIRSFLRCAALFFSALRWVPHTETRWKVSEGGGHAGVHASTPLKFKSHGALSNQVTVKQCVTHPPPWGDSVFCFTVRAPGFKESDPNASYSRHPQPPTMKIYILSQLPTCMYVWHHLMLFSPSKVTKTQPDTNICAAREYKHSTVISNKTLPVSCLSPSPFFSPTCPIFPGSCSFMGSKMGAGPSITSNISVSNLMRRCEWILKQAGEAPGVACAGPPGPAAGLNKYAAEQTCRQLGPDMAAAVCVVALRRALRRKQRDSSVFPGRRGGEKKLSWGTWRRAVCVGSSCTDCSCG